MKTSLYRRKLAARRTQALRAGPPPKPGYRSSYRAKHRR